MSTWDGWKRAVQDYAAEHYPDLQGWSLVSCHAETYLVGSKNELVIAAGDAFEVDGRVHQEDFDEVVEKIYFPEGHMMFTLQKGKKRVAIVIPKCILPRD